jgi:hypothetical protein
VPNALKSRSFRALAVVAALLGLYAVAGFWLAPKFVRSLLVENIQAGLGITPSIGDIRLNPFLLQVEVADFSLPDAAGAKLVGFQRLFIDFSPASLWRGALVFKAVAIDAPFANAVVAADGALNLLRLRPKPGRDSHPAAGPPLAVHVGDFTVSRGALSYEDLSRPSHFATRLEPIDIDLRDFSTASEGRSTIPKEPGDQRSADPARDDSGRFTFTGTSKLGERIEWHGRLGVQPVRSDGELRIDGLEAQTIWEYLADRLGFRVDSGIIDVAASYRFVLEDSIELKVDVAKFSLSDLGIRPRGGESVEDWIKVPSLMVTGASVDLASRVAHVDSVALTGLKLTAWLNPDKSLNLSELAGPPDAAASSAPAMAAHAPPWRFDVHDFSLEAAHIHAEDRSVQPAATFIVAPLSFRVTGASQDLAKPVNIAFDASIDGAGRVKVGGDLTPQPLSANLAVTLAALDLKALQPYLQQYTSMTLLGGRLSADARIRVGSSKPAVRVDGNLHVERLHTVDNALRADFVSWDRLDVSGIRYTHGPDRLDIDSIVARKPYARVIIEADDSMNVKRVLTAPGATAASAGVTGAAPVGRHPRTGRAAKAGPAAANAAPSLPLAIHRIVVHGGEANFSDLSVQPNFTAGIQALEGSVTGLSSAPDSRARIDLHGQVDAFAPVLISGEANVLSRTLYTDVAMSFRNMELTMFNPYSGKFAGYDIAKGKLTTEFHYKVAGRTLDARHHVIVEQLEFGDRTESKDAVSLPVKLAVSLLKDRNGVIDLELPVTGSLDDPEFRLAPLIGKVLMNLLVKAVTAPFALLGSLFGGGPDLQFIDFGPGASALDAPASERLKAVAKVLVERPQLRIEVPIAAVPDIDRQALVEAKFNAEVRDPALRAGKSAAAGLPDFDQLDPRAQLQLLTALYRKVFGAAPIFPDAGAPGTPKDQLVADRVAYLEKTLRQHIVVDDADLRKLAEQRASMVQQSLLTGTEIDPARVYLVVNDKARAQDGRARLELVLQ